MAKIDRQDVILGLAIINSIVLLAILLVTLF